MRFVIAFALAIAAFMGWQALQPVCPGGAVIVGEADCRAKFDAAFCSRAIPELDRVAKTSGTSYPTQSACLEQWPVCIERSDAPLWTPRPANYCVARAADGGVSRIAPIYARR